MPIPVVPVGIAVGSAIGGLLLWWQWRSIKAFFLRTTLAVLGQRKTGKTTLITRLVEKKILTQYTATGSPVRREGVRLAGGDDDVLRFRDIGDVGGGADDRDVVWKEQFNRAADARERGIVLYIVDIKCVMAQDENHCARVKSDAAKLREWQEERKLEGKRGAPPRVVVIASHADQLENWPDPHALSLDKFRKSEVFEDFRKLDGFRGAVVGQLNDEKAVVSVLDEVIRLVR